MENYMYKDTDLIDILFDTCDKRIDTILRRLDIDKNVEESDFDIFPVNGGLISPEGGFILYAEKGKIIKKKVLLNTPVGMKDKAIENKEKEFISNKLKSMDLDSRWISVGRDYFELVKAKDNGGGTCFTLVGDDTLKTLSEYGMCDVNIRDYVRDMCFYYLDDIILEYECTAVLDLISEDKGIIPIPPGGYDISFTLIKKDERRFEIYYVSSITRSYVLVYQSFDDEKSVLQLSSLIGRMSRGIVMTYARDMTIVLKEHIPTHYDNMELSFDSSYV